GPAAPASRERQADHGEGRHHQQRAVESGEQGAPRDASLFWPRARVRFPEVFDGERLVVVGVPELLRHHHQPGAWVLLDLVATDLCPTAVLLNLPRDAGAAVL